MSPEIGINPLPWLLGPDGFDLSAATVADAAAAMAAAGFDAIQADVPAGMSSDEYRSLLTEHGLRPAPGYFSAHFDGPADELPELLERAHRHAAVQRELGLTEVFIASHLNETRREAPAVGAGFDAGRLDTIVERIASAAQAIREEGLLPCLHPHVGSWIETADEVRTVLGSIDSSVLAFGPDVGHLYWAGADPAAVITEFSSRVGAVHLKDVHGDEAEKAHAAGADYRTATHVHHVWTEPGRGDIDFDAVFAALPADYAGWFVIEVDVPDLPTKEESTAETARWIVAVSADFTS
jgi:inosose dehydratase